MKSLLLAALLATSFISCTKKQKDSAQKPQVSTAKDIAGEVSVDLAKSKIEWIGRKITEDHRGFVSLKSGKLNFENSHLQGGEFVIDMNSITCSDIESPDLNKKIVAHLKNDDFFSTDKFPEASLKITHVMLGKGLYDIVADLTIKGKTHPVTFQADLVQSNQGQKKITGKIIFDRTLYDVRYNSGKFFESLGDRLIYDDVELRVELALF